MNTPAHAAINLVLLGRGRDTPQIPIFLGSILPDAPIVIFYFVNKLVWRISETEIWHRLYYQAPWQNFFDVFNSIPLILLGLIACWMLAWKWWVFLFLGMLFHTLLDLPLHHDDGHRHFFPFSDWRFQSPVSYWDPNHHGNLVFPIEIILVVACCIILFIRYQRLAARVSVGAFGLVYMGYLGYVALVWM